MTRDNVMRTSLLCCTTIGSIVTVIGLVGYASSSSIERQKSYDTSFKYAVKTIGDEKQPMTGDELRTWYRLMMVDEGTRASKSDLDSFVKKVQDHYFLEGTMPRWEADRSMTNND